MLSVRCSAITWNNIGLLPVGPAGKMNDDWFQIEEEYELTNPKSFSVGVFIFFYELWCPKNLIFYCPLTENKDAGHKICCCFNFCQKDHEIQWGMSLSSNYYGYYLGILLCRQVTAPHLRVAHPPMCSLLWRHIWRDGASNRQPHDCLLNRSFRRRPKKTPKLRVTGLCGNSPVNGEFPAQMASNAENVSIWWRHHVSENWQRDMIPG